MEFWNLGVLSVLSCRERSLKDCPLDIFIIVPAQDLPFLPSFLIGMTIGEPEMSCLRFFFAHAHRLPFSAFSCYHAFLLSRPVFVLHAIACFFTMPRGVPTLRVLFFSCPPFCPVHFFLSHRLRSLSFLKEGGDPMIGMVPEKRQAYFQSMCTVFLSFFFSLASCHPVTSPSPLAAKNKT